MKLSKKLRLWFINDDSEQAFRMIEQAETLEKKVKELEEALFRFMPVSFHGDTKAFDDSGFTEAFKKMVVLAYLKEIPARRQDKK